MSIIATGLLTEVALREPYRNKKTGEMVTPREACIANGRRIDVFDVGQKVGAELDALVGQRVEASVLYVTNWREVAGKNVPDRKLVLVGVRAEGSAAPVVQERQPEAGKTATGQQKAA